MFRTHEIKTATRIVSQLECHWLVSSDSAVLNCIALASGLMGVSRMTVRENHLLFDWRREVREWEGEGREGGGK